jgi:hypothetical protein
MRVRPYAFLILCLFLNLVESFISLSIPPIFLVPSAKMSFGVLILGLLLFLIMHQAASTHFKGPISWFHKRLAHPGVKPVVPSFLHPARLRRNRDY